MALWYNLDKTKWRTLLEVMNDLQITVTWIWNIVIIPFETVIAIIFSKFVINLCYVTERWRSVTYTLRNRKMEVVFFLLKSLWLTVPHHQNSLRECRPDMSMCWEDIPNFSRYFVMFYLFIKLVHCEKKLPVKIVASLLHSTWIFHERFKVCVIWIVLFQALIVTHRETIPTWYFPAQR